MTQLDLFREKLGLPLMTEIYEKSPFSESLREYSRKHKIRFPYHVEIEYHNDHMVTVFISFKNYYHQLSGKVEWQDPFKSDPLDDIQDQVAKDIVEKYF